MLSSLGQHGLPGRVHAGRNEVTALNGDDQSAEEFYSVLLQRGHVLGAAAIEYAAAGDALMAMLLQWATDIAVLQSVAWERIVVVTHTPQTPLFALGDKLMRGFPQAQANEQDAHALIERMREVTLAVVDDDLAGDVSARWADISYLQGLEPITGSVRERRMGEESPEAFLEHRAVEAQARMQVASQARIRGDVVEAITAAYEADMLTFEAYLVESAIAIGDEELATVGVRWELASAALRALPQVPADVVGAVSLVRTTVVTALGQADGARLARTWIPLP